MFASNQKWSATFACAAFVCVVADWRSGALCFLLLTFVRIVQEGM